MRAKRLKCDIYGKAQHNKVATNCRIEESERVTIILKAASHLMDEVSTTVTHLQDAFDVFSADIDVIVSV